MGGRDLVVDEFVDHLGLLLELDLFGQVREVILE